jgi:mRNA-degrading endonuclease YafQ of YafQ-DinJ toxin-antitoxin module
MLRTVTCTTGKLFQVCRYNKCASQRKFPANVSRTKSGVQSKGLAVSILEVHKCLLRCAALPYQVYKHELLSGWEGAAKVHVLQNQVLLNRNEYELSGKQEM